MIRENKQTSKVMASFKYLQDGAESGEEDAGGHPLGPGLSENT